MYGTIKGILDSAFGCDVALNIPKDFKMGHFATPIAFNLAKKLQKNPNQIAQDLCAKLANRAEFAKVEALNGYVNLTLSDEFLSKIAQDTLNRGDFREILDSRESYGECDSHESARECHESKSDSRQNILLEFVSANPTGPLHIGHARGAIWGDTMARIGRFLGHKITTEYYINDAGSQIDMLGYSIFKAGREILGLPKIDLQDSRESQESNFYQGAYINDLAREAICAFGEEIFRADSIDLANLAPLRAFGVEKMLDLIKDNLNCANINFDNFISEKSLICELDSTLKSLESHNALYKSDGKIWLKSTQFGDEKDRVIVRENGAPTYLAGDIIYHAHKFKREFDKYINIWGADHHGYIARIKASVAFLGFDSSKLEVLLSQMVSLLKDAQPYKMSKRAGNFILMSEIIDELGIDALRFVFLTKRADTHLEFDIADLRREDSSNPIFYINYANARIHTLLGKSSADANFDFTNLDSAWKDLLFYALLLPQILEVAFNERAMQKLPEYLKNLASKLHICYNAHKILGSDFEGAICAILRVVSLSLTTGLNLMGIVAKTKM